MTLLLTVEEVAKRLHLHPRTVAQRIARREIAVIRPGRKPLVSEADLEAYINSIRLPAVKLWR